MANTRLSALTGLSTPVGTDVLYIVDVSDTTDNAGGSSRKLTLTNLFAQANTINTDLATLTGTETLTNKTLTAPQFADGGFIADPNGDEILLFNNTSSAVNYVEIRNQSTGNGPTIIAAGSDTNIDLNLSAKGTGAISIGDNLQLTSVTPDIIDGSSLELLRFSPTSSAVNEFTIASAATGNAPTLSATGGDDNIGINITPKGNERTYFTQGDVNLATGANISVNSADPWRTVSIFGGLKPTTTAGCATKATVEAGTNDIDYDVLDFDTSTDENAFVNFQMPDSYDGGVIQFRYVWTNAAGLTTETVTFELSGIAFANDDAIDQAVGTPVEVADTWIAQGDIHISAWSGDVTLAGTPAGGQYVHFEVMRDVSEDDLTGDCRLLDLQIRYKQQSFSD